MKVNAAFRKRQHGVCMPWSVIKAPDSESSEADKREEIQFFGIEPRASQGKITISS
jgi:hypothetical protein